MLVFDAISEEALILLKKVSELKAMSEFALAGGTALALQLGHRRSEDLDFFTQKSFNGEVLLQTLSKKFKVEIINRDENTLNLLIDDVKTDILSYQYPLIEEIKIYDSLRLFSIKDIAAMKLSAISSRGSKKDFYDLYYLLKSYTLKDLLEFYKEKFSTTQYYHVLKSLIYFDDAEKDPDPKLINNSLTWTEIKKQIEKKVEAFIRS